MENALHEVQTIVLFGGTSEIGRAIVDELLTPTTKTLVLAVRHPDDARADRFERPGLDVVVEPFDSTKTTAHRDLVRRLANAYGDLDVAIMAFGVLGSQAEFDQDNEAAAAAIEVNFSGAVSIMTAVAAQMRTQGHGHIAVLSSVAGERARAANYVYGASKAGLDAFSQGLADALAPEGVNVTVIRPGFVHSKMTQGMKSAPFAATPSQVAKVAVKGMRAGKHTVWAPPILRYVFSTLRHVPRPVFRRLPLG